MKEHYCPVDKTVISYEGECSWCGEKEKWQYLTDAEILEIISGGRISEGNIGYEGGIGSYTRELFDKIEKKIREKNT
jgi:hypothetical protein